MMEPAALAERLGAHFSDVQVARGEAAVIVQPEELLASLEYLRADSDIELDFLSDLSATDWPGSVPRFWLAYQLYSIRLGHRLRVKVGLTEEDARIPTVTGLYPTADWLEREVFDFFGVVFDGHPDLRRILMPDDWEGHPLRKDYALGGTGTHYRGGAFIPPVDQRGM
jgi:NADH-quinone oxidoreductase subunit C